MVRRTWIAIALLLTALAPAFGAQEALEKEPGYVDFDRLGLYANQDDLEVEVTLQDGLIRMFSGIFREEEPELADALSKLRSFRFRLFSLPQAEIPVQRRRSAATISALEEGGWERVVQIRTADNWSSLYIKWRGQAISGLFAVFVDEDGTFGLINVVGEIDPAQIGRIGQNWDLEILEEAQRELSTGEKDHGDKTDGEETNQEEATGKKDNGEKASGGKANSEEADGETATEAEANSEEVVGETATGAKANSEEANSEEANSREADGGTANAEREAQR